MSFYCVYYYSETSNPFEERGIHAELLFLVVRFPRKCAVDGVWRSQQRHSDNGNVIIKLLLRVYMLKFMWSVYLTQQYGALRTVNLKLPLSYLLLSVYFIFWAGTKFCWSAIGVGSIGLILFLSQQKEATCWRCKTSGWRLASGTENGEMRGKEWGGERKMSIRWTRHRNAVERMSRGGGETQLYSTCMFISIFIELFHPRLLFIPVAVQKYNNR